jgi:hypothetical protein
MRDCNRQSPRPSFGQSSFRPIPLKNAPFAVAMCNTHSSERDGVDRAILISFPSETRVHDRNEASHENSQRICFASS